ncbi:MAG: glycosyltransferase [Saprospiraceae bacterium]|nr:glycosyltransferase [Saprospiraceae bacterium]
MNSGPKVLIVGQWMWHWYQSACASALASLGCQVIPFDWLGDFYYWKSDNIEPVYKSKWAMLQNRFLWGPKLMEINRRLYRQALQLRPDVIWFFNCTHIFPNTARTLQQRLPDTVLAQYTNDNPFGMHIKPDYWRHFKRSIPFFDVHFVYRYSNVADFRRAGARDVHLLRSYYLPSEDYHVELGPDNIRFECDVVFAGHYEADGRLEMLQALAQRGVKVNLFGGGWRGATKRLDSANPLIAQFPVAPAIGENYRKAISGAKIALCFLSKLNTDTYTRRNFQIPAMQTFMLSEYSDDLADLFQEGVEAEYFRSTDELLDKTRFYLDHPELIKQVAQRGYERVVKDGHDVTSRMKFFLAVVSNCAAEKAEKQNALP